MTINLDFENMTQRRKHAEQMWEEAMNTAWYITHFDCYGVVGIAFRWGLVCEEDIAKAVLMGYEAYRALVDKLVREFPDLLTKETFYAEHFATRRCYIVRRSEYDTAPDLRPVTQPSNIIPGPRGWELPTPKPAEMHIGPIFVVACWQATERDYIVQTRCANCGQLSTDHLTWCQKRYYEEALEALARHEPYDWQTDPSLLQYLCSRG